MLSILVTIILSLIIIKKNKIGIIITSMVVQPMTYIGSGIGTISMYYILAFLCFITFLLSKYKQNLRTYPKPILITTILMATSFLITNTICQHTNTSLVVANILTQLIFPAIFWCALNNEKSLYFAIKCLLLICSIAIIAVIPELIFRHNYATDFITKIFSISDFYIDTSGIRFGLKRTNSIFSYFSTFGVFCVLACYIVWILNIKYEYKNKKYLILLFILSFCAFSTGSRAVFLGIICIIIFLFTKKEIIKSTYFKIIIICSLIFMPLLIDLIIEILNSMINSGSESTIEGSSTALRLLQWEACLPAFLQSPIWGNGRMYIWDYAAPSAPILLGAESLWFSLLVDYGIMGAIAYTLMIIACCVVLYKYEPRLIGLPIGYFLILSLSPDSGIEYNLLLTFVILSIKIYQFYYHKTSKKVCHESFESN